MAPLELSGIVTPGRALGAQRMANSGIIDRLQKLVGFPVVPGTLNVRLPEPIERSPDWRYIASADITPEWEAETGQAGYFVALALVADHYRCLAFQADEPGYPSDLIELVGEVHIRSTLGMRDGDPISFSVFAPNGGASRLSRVFRPMRRRMNQAFFKRWSIMAA